jgi:hypothetical protein
MSFYEVDIYSSNIAGTASDQESLIAAMRIVEKFFPSGDCKNAGWCIEFKRKTYSEGSTLYHSFMIRENVALEIVKSGSFSSTKKQGIGRQTHIEYLEGLVSSATPAWFQLEMSEI